MLSNVVFLSTLCRVWYCQRTQNHGGSARNGRQLVQSLRRCKRLLWSELCCLGWTIHYFCTSSCRFHSLFYSILERTAVKIVISQFWLPNVHVWQQQSSNRKSNSGIKCELLSSFTYLFVHSINDGVPTNSADDLWVQYCYR